MKCDLPPNTESPVRPAISARLAKRLLAASSRSSSVKASTLLLGRPEEGSCPSRPICFLFRSGTAPTQQHQPIIKLEWLIPFSGSYAGHFTRRVQAYPNLGITMTLAKILPTTPIRMPVWIMNRTSREVEGQLYSSLEEQSSKPSNVGYKLSQSP